MSKADQLGNSASFNRAAGARSSRRASFESSLKGDAAATDSITELPVPVISENPDNPRNHLRNLDEIAQSVREIGIILPIVVGTTEAYLRERPDRGSDLDDGAQYVVIDGHRRLEAAREVGLATIPVRVDNGRLATDEALLEAAFVANYHRDDMTDLEEAHALQQLVTYYGSQIKACKRLSLSPSTLSSKLSLLKLAPELQKDLMTGERRVEHVRNLGKLAPSAQKEKADERAEAARRKAEVSRNQPAGQPTSVPGEIHGVNNHGSVTVEAAEQDAPPAPDSAATPPGTHITQPDTAHHSTTQEPSNEAEVPRQASGPRQLPYGNAFYVVHHLHAKMQPDVFAQGAQIWLRILREQHPEEYKALMLELGQQEQPA